MWLKYLYVSWSPISHSSSYSYKLFKNKMIPVFCCGEKKIDRENNKHFDVIESQIRVLLSFGKENVKKSIIAYEPVWAIGTGNNASPNQAEEVHSFIRELLKKKFNEEIANSVSLLYGGSCNGANARSLFSMPNIDGGLIGSASLYPNSFLEIINS